MSEEEEEEGEQKVRMGFPAATRTPTFLLFSLSSSYALSIPSSYERGNSGPVTVSELQSQDGTCRGVTCADTGLFAVPS